MGRHLKIMWIGPVIIVLLCGLLSACGAGDDLPLFQSDFEEGDNGWDEVEEDTWSRGYDAGEYFIDLSQPNLFAWADVDTRFRDVDVETYAHLVSGPSDAHFGLICRYTNTKNFYYFAVTADGYYGIFKRVDGEDLQLLTGNGAGLLPADAIETDGGMNRIRAICQGDQLSLYVNGELLATVTDDDHARGAVGLGAGSGSAGARVQFDNFTVYAPAPED